VDVGVAAGVPVATPLELETRSRTAHRRAAVETMTAREPRSLRDGTAPICETAIGCPSDGSTPNVETRSMHTQFLVAVGAATFFCLYLFPGYLSSMLAC
tara:strand:+ start:6364 stop:6660 length:297 start_codon:yes stop_codon:yes gene_type:complete